ncbi:hypothetical protein HDU82_005317 [Entophlyctis luteolus]|nr:hypothetical protein HDU82_005317 [Entophlyctis luteolus]
MSAPPASSAPVVLAFKGLPAALVTGATLTNAWLDIGVAPSKGVENSADITFDLVGFAKVAFVIPPDSMFADEGMTDRRSRQLRRIDSEEVFATVSQKLADPQSIAHGSHTFGLSLDIPLNLCPSFLYTTPDRSELYSIRYVLRATFPMKDNKSVVLEHNVIVSAPSIGTNEMDPLALIEFRGNVFNSVISLQARRNQFKPLEPISLLYTHLAPPNRPIQASYLELVQMAGLPVANGSQERRGVERIIATYEIPGIPSGLSNTHTLLLTLPQLPPTICLGPIDISYVLRIVATFGEAGHEVLGPVDIVVLPDVQPLNIPPGWDEAVEVLEGSPTHTNGVLVRPRILQLTQWIPPIEPVPLVAPPQQFTPLIQQQPLQQSFFPQQPQQPRANSYTEPIAAPVWLQPAAPLQPQQHASTAFAEQARLIQEQQLELEAIRAETERVRTEYLARLAAEEEARRQEEARAAEIALEAQLRSQREEMEQLRKQIEELKTRSLSRNPPETPPRGRQETESVPTQAPLPVAKEEVTARVVPQSIPHSQPPPPKYPPPGFIPTKGVRSSSPTHMEESESYLQARVQKKPSAVWEGSMPRLNPVFAEHHYPKPAPISTGLVVPDVFPDTPPDKEKLAPVGTSSYKESQKHNRLSIFSLGTTATSTASSPPNAPGQSLATPIATISRVPSNSNLLKPKKKWWFSSRQQPQSNSASSVGPSGPATKSHSMNELETVVNQICEQAAANYRRAIKLNYKQLMSKRERDSNKRSCIKDAEEMVSGILEPKDVSGVIAALEAEFLVIDSETTATFVSDSKASLTRQVRTLKEALASAIAANAVADDKELAEQYSAALKPLRAELTRSVFGPSADPADAKDLERVANDVWSHVMRFFDSDVKPALAAELRKRGSTGRRGNH